MMVRRDNPTVGFSRLVWLGLFVVATIALSLVFQSFKVFTLAPTAFHGLILTGNLVLFFAAMIVLIYDGYAKDKARGKSIREFKPFEWLYSKQYGSNDDGGQ